EAHDHALVLGLGLCDRPVADEPVEQLAVRHGMIRLERAVDCPADLLHVRPRPPRALYRSRRINQRTPPLAARANRSTSATSTRSSRPRRSDRTEPARAQEITIHSLTPTSNAAAPGVALKPSKSETTPLSAVGAGSSRSLP